MPWTEQDAIAHQDWFDAKEQQFPGLKQKIGEAGGRMGLNPVQSAEMFYYGLQGAQPDATGAPPAVAPADPAMGAQVQAPTASQEAPVEDGGFDPGKYQGLMDRLNGGGSTWDQRLASSIGSSVGGGLAGVGASLSASATGENAALAASENMAPFLSGSTEEDKAKNLELLFKMYGAELEGRKEGRAARKEEREVEAFNVDLTAKRDKSDPNSAISVAMRKEMQRIGIDFGPDATYAMMEKTVVPAMSAKILANTVSYQGATLGGAEEGREETRRDNAADEYRAAQKAYQVQVEKIKGDLRAGRFGEGDAAVERAQRDIDAIPKPETSGGGGGSVREPTYVEGAAPVDFDSINKEKERRKRGEPPSEGFDMSDAELDNLMETSQYKKTALERAGTTPAPSATTIPAPTTTTTPSPAAAPSTFKTDAQIAVERKEAETLAMDRAKQLTAQEQALEKYDTVVVPSLDRADTILTKMDSDDWFAKLTGPGPLSQYAPVDVAKRVLNADYQALTEEVNKIVQNTTVAGKGDQNLQELLLRMQGTVRKMTDPKVGRQAIQNLRNDMEQLRKIVAAKGGRAGTSRPTTNPKDDMPALPTGKTVIKYGRDGKKYEVDPATKTVLREIP